MNSIIYPLRMDSKTAKLLERLAKIEERTRADTIRRLIRQAAQAKFADASPNSTNSENPSSTIPH